jgi:hypothetical protein
MKDKVRRKSVGMFSKTAPSSLKIVVEDAQKLCNECFKKQVQTAANQILEEIGF